MFIGMEKDMRNNKDRNKNDIYQYGLKLWKISSFMLLLFSLFMIGTTLYGLKKENDYFEVLAAAKEEQMTVKNKESSIEEEQKNDPIKYEKLVTQNKDFFGWIKIENTPLDYPVMYSPDDPEFYLSHDFEKNKSISGIPFVDGDYTEGCGIYIIYGHNMKNGTMFHTILGYKDYDFWQQHKIITFHTLSEDQTYEVVSAFYSKTYRKDEKNVFRFYNYKDIRDEKTFYEFAGNVKESALYETGEMPIYGDELLVLVTCSYHTEEGKFVVVARRIQQE